jgi:hypothetical protein
MAKVGQVKHRRGCSICLTLLGMRNETEHGADVEQRPMDSSVQVRARHSPSLSRWESLPITKGTPSVTR